MTVVFVVEQAGCQSCAALVRDALEPLGAVASIEVDEEADTATVRLEGTASPADVDRVLADVSRGAGHAYRIQPGSWHPT